MPTDSADGAQGTPFVRRFQDHVTLLEYDGRPLAVAREFGAMLGYSEGGKALQALISGDWAQEFIDEIDFVILRNGRLAEFKRICAELGLDLVDKRAPSLLLLTESGIQLVLARTEKPEGKAFRRWLVAEVIPEYHRGRALPGPTAAEQLAGEADAELPAPRALPPSNPAPAAPQPPAAVRVLRSLVERFHVAGQIKPPAYVALDVALVEAEALTDPLHSLDALPLDRHRPDPDGPARGAIFGLLCGRMAGLSGDDLERIERWVESRPYLVSGPAREVPRLEDHRGRRGPK